MAYPHDPATLRSLSHAAEKDIARPLLFGDQDRIMQVAEAENIPTNGLTLFDVKDEDEAIRRTVQAVIRKDAEILMKGSCTTRSILGAVLRAGREMIRKGNLMSFVGLFYAPMYERLIIITDPAVNINPNLNRKLKIIHNSIAAARKLGIRTPRVAILAAIEKVNISKMPITGEAQLIEKMSKAGIFKNAFVEGPFALDNAVSPSAATIKHLSGEVAGKADILVSPDIESANILYKSLISFTDIPFANVAVGARVPIVLPSRADSEKTKIASIALSSFLSA